MTRRHFERATHRHADADLPHQINDYLARMTADGWTLEHVTTATGMYYQSLEVFVTYSFFWIRDD